MSLPTQEAEKEDTLDGLVLARIAGARSGSAKRQGKAPDRGLDKGELAADLAPFAGPEMPASRWRAAIDAALERLTAAKLIAATPGGFVATKSGTPAAAKFLGAPASFVVAWEQACSIWLIGKVLGVKRSPAKRLAALATADGLRAAILVQAYGLTFKGKAAPTPTRLRQALAAIALKRAFGGGQGAAGLADKLGLSARASRLLAAQLLDKPRDPGTDRRLVSLLAVQACGATGDDLAALRAAVLRRLLTPVSRVSPTATSLMAPTADAERSAGRTVPSPVAPEARPRNVGEGHGGGESRASNVGVSPTPNSSLQGGGEARRARGEVGVSGPPPPTPVARQSVPAATAAAPTPATRHPTPAPLDLPRFASEVRRCAAGEAQGWSGDRKAYISRVWRSLRQQQPDWGLSEIEFKGLLAEAHRLGQLALANADLKDASNIKDVQDSALIYKNAVFHFIRVDA